MDIEGAEYECLGSVITSPELSQLTALVVEFHSIHENQDKFDNLLEKIGNNFVISNIHINNFAESWCGIPRVVEMVFMNKKFLNESSTFVNSIPHFLDRPCDPRRPDIFYQY